MIASEKIQIDLDKIMDAMHASSLIAELKGHEIDILTGLLAVRHYRAGEFIAKPGACSLGDALLILVEGQIEVSAFVENEPLVMTLKDPGDLARIISFVGSNMMRIEASIEVKEDCAVLLLERSRLESLLDTHRSIVYCVMRGLVRYAHGLARHKSAETEQMSNYFFRVNGRY
ncbi:MAG: cyclic nucleotide-binding domain-containing protein [Nitrosomonadales bacterium]|nr:cyclic nucleotide-binding domain-containing protein [Nitrosomonadales bacterium]